MNKADFWISKLALKKHPEGGFYREVYRSEETIPLKGLPRRFKGARSFATSIYFLLKDNEVSRFHRLNSDETWHFYTGQPVTLHIISPSGKYSRIILGAHSGKNQLFQFTISKHHWFGAAVEGRTGFSLVGCTVAPGFDFADFEMATRDKLLKNYPRHRAIILKLTSKEIAKSPSKPL